MCINDGKNRNIDEEDDIPVAEAMHPYQWENQRKNMQNILNDQN